MSGSTPNLPSILGLLEAHRSQGATSWNLPPWGNILSHSVYPFFIFVEEHFIPIGTAFCISDIGVVITATHNIEEALKLDRQPQRLPHLNNLRSEDTFNLKDVGLSLLQVQIDGSNMQVNFRPLENGSIVRPTDVMFGFQSFRQGASLLPLRISFVPPRIGSKVICLGYTATDPPSACISKEAFESGEIKDWFEAYTHRFCAIEGTVTKIFTKSFAPCKGACFAIDAEVPHGLSGGPVFNRPVAINKIRSPGRSSRDRRRLRARHCRT